MTQDRLTREAVLRIGEVTEVSGQRVVVRVDKNKNSSDLLFDGDVLKNISVNSYVEIRKGFTSLIGKVDGERLDDLAQGFAAGQVQKTDRNKRFLQVSLAGFIDGDGRFRGGLRELPLIGNEVFIVTKDTLETIHNLVDDGRPSIRFAVTDNEGFDIAFPIDGLFNSHIAIFGNTGSGKSNTLAGLYSAFVETLMARDAAAYRANVRVLLFDFNGEYVADECVTTEKHVYQLSTGKAADRLPVPAAVLADIEMLSILSDATDKTQKPFLRRALSFYEHVFSDKVGDATSYFKAILKKNVEQTLRMSDKVMLRVDGGLYVVANHTGATHVGRHGARIRIGERDLQVRRFKHLRFELLEFAKPGAHRRNLVREARRLRFRSIAFLRIRGIKRLQVARYALGYLLHASFELAAREVALARIDGLKLCAVDSGDGVIEHTDVAADRDESGADRLDR